jgi:uncharacterized membrane protein
MLLWKRVFLGVVVLLALDAAYLYVQQQTFKRQIELVQKSKVVLRPWAIGACYLFIVAGLYYFIWRERRPALDAGLLGALIYGVYDTTTLALLENWSVGLATLDVVWGFVLFFTATAVVNARW